MLVDSPVSSWLSNPPFLLCAMEIDSSLHLAIACVTP
jgi:hypothetical protein